MEEIPAKIIKLEDGLHLVIHIDYWDKLKELLTVKKGGRK